MPKAWLRLQDANAIYKKIFGAENTLYYIGEMTMKILYDKYVISSTNNCKGKDKSIIQIEIKRHISQLLLFKIQIQTSKF